MLRFIIHNVIVTDCNIFKLRDDLIHSKKVARIYKKNPQEFPVFLKKSGNQN